MCLTARRAAPAVSQGPSHVLGDRCSPFAGNTFGYRSRIAYAGLSAAGGQWVKSRFYTKHCAISVYSNIDNNYYDGAFVRFQCTDASFQILQHY